MAVGTWGSTNVAPDEVKFYIEQLCQFIADDQPLFGTGSGTSATYIAPEKGLVGADKVIGNLAAIKAGITKLLLGVGSAPVWGIGPAHTINPTPATPAIETLSAAENLICALVLNHGYRDHHKRAFWIYTAHAGDKD